MLELQGIVERLALLDSASQCFNRVFLGDVFELPAFVSGLLDFIVHLLELSESLFNSGVELHGVLSRVSESLLQVSDLPGQLSVRR